MEVKETLALMSMVPCLWAASMVVPEITQKSIATATVRDNAVRLPMRLLTVSFRAEWEFNEVNYSSAPGLRQGSRGNLSG
ncbi:MAG TPA: hypothetical protein VJ124_24455 [Pyrinomonadaceae bacterium]|nr:hypothetical protein [Pyrinomonadaceae bacterium]